MKNIASLGFAPAPVHSESSARTTVIITTSDIYVLKGHISRGHSEPAKFLGFGTFRHFLQFVLPCANMSSPGGGGMCILFEICCFLGLFIGLKGLLMAAAALVLATDSTTNFDILK